MKRKPYIERKKHTPRTVPVETHDERIAREARRSEFQRANPQLFTFHTKPI